MTPILSCFYSLHEFDISCTEGKKFDAIKLDFVLLSVKHKQDETKFWNL